METFKQRLNELIRIDMDYLPEDLSDKISYEVNFDKSETKEEFLSKMNQTHIVVLQLFAQAESAKQLKSINKTLSIILYIIIATVTISIISGLILIF